MAKQDYFELLPTRAGDYTTAGEVKGVAIWLPPEHTSINDIRLLQLGFIAFPLHIQLKGLGEFFSIFSRFKEYRQDMIQPHWYLMMLGVSPAYQNQGIGGALLQPILQRADQEEFPCYLETSTEGGVRFYQRQGFEILRSDRVANGRLPFWTMKREPQAKG
jgi:ribosomal protein S18 acetylase RimI-like enzyme